MLRKFPAVPAGVIAATTLMAALAGPQAVAADTASPVPVPCSTAALASALAAPVGGETIRLAAGCDYVLTTALPPISTDLTIKGRGATLERSTAARTPGFAILTVNEGDLSVSNLNVRNGVGGIDFDKTTDQTNNITVTRSTFTGNAGGINLGGPDASASKATATITGSTFTHNAGGINDDRVSLTVTGSTFNGNTGGGLTTEEGEIDHQRVGAIIVTGSTFSGNSGGGITCRGGEPCKVTVTCSVFSHNTGSGINAHNTADVSISATHSVFRGNKSSYDGGGIELSDDISGELTAADDIFRDNTATVGGGGIFNLDSATLTGDTFTGNKAANGGAMENESDATVTDTTFRRNKASADGGAIYQENLFGVGTLHITGGRITGNTAGGDGGGIYNAGPPGGKASVSPSTTVRNNLPDNCAPLGSVGGCTG
jgi:predicted outer membrane repeat protein